MAAAHRDPAQRPGGAAGGTLVRHRFQGAAQRPDARARADLRVRGDRGIRGGDAPTALAAGPAGGMGRRRRPRGPAGAERAAAAHGGAGRTVQGASRPSGSSAAQRQVVGAVGLPAAQRLHPELPGVPQPARQLDGRLDLPDRKADLRPLRRRPAEHALQELLPADGARGGTRAHRDRHPGGGPRLPQLPGGRPEGRATRQTRRLLPAPEQALHGRHPHPRGRVRAGGALAGGDELLLPGNPRCRAQLPSPLVAPIHLPADIRGPLPSQRPLRDRRRAPLRHRSGGDRRAGRLAREQGERGDPDGRRHGRDGAHGPLDATLPTLVPGPSLAARIRQGNDLRGRSRRRHRRDGRRVAGVHPGPALRRRPRFRRPLASPRDRHVRRTAADGETRRTPLRRLGGQSAEWADRRLPALRGARPGGLRRRPSSRRSLPGDRGGGLGRGQQSVRPTRGSAGLMKPIDRGTWLALIAMGMAAFVLANDFSAINVAIPQIEKDFDTSVTTTQWVVNAYALTFGVLLVTGGRLADLFGRRRAFFVGTAIFATFSVLGGAAQTEAELIATRVVMGIGGALMWPAILGMTYAALPEERSAFAGALILGVCGLGNAAGPLIGGVLTDLLSWRWIFFLNLPVAALAAFVTWREVH